MPNGDSGLLVASGLSDFGGALMAAERDNSEALLVFTPTVPDVLELLVQSRATRPEMGARRRHPRPGQRLARRGAHGRRPRDRHPAGRAHGRRERGAEGRRPGRRPRRTPRRARSTPARRSIVVLGPKGGVGKTTVATNLATTLAARRPAHAADRPRPPVRRRRTRAGRRARPHDPRPGDRPGPARRRAPARLRGQQRRRRRRAARAGSARPGRGGHPRAAGGGARRRAAEYDVVVVDTPPAFTSTAIAADRSAPSTP